MVVRVHRQIAKEPPYQYNAPAWRVLQELLGLPRHRVSYWDADHILPIVEGGDVCALENHRTLCYWCHQGQTSALATRRAEARRAEPQRFRQPSLFA